MTKTESVASMWALLNLPIYRLSSLEDCISPEQRSIVTRALWRPSAASKACRPGCAGVTECDCRALVRFLLRAAVVMSAASLESRLIVRMG